MYNTLKKSCTLSLLLFIHLSLLAQENYNIFKYDKKNTKLSANIIHDLTIDSDNQLIVSSPMEIYVYNGIDFNRINITSKQRIISIIKNSENTILAVLSNGQIYKIQSNQLKSSLLIENKIYKYPTFKYNYSFVNGPISFSKKIINTNIIEYDYFRTHSVYHQDKSAFLVRNSETKSFYWLDTQLNYTIIKSYTPRNNLKFLYHYKDIITLEGNLFQSNISNNSFKLPTDLDTLKGYYFINKPNESLIVIQNSSLWSLNSNYNWELITTQLPSEIIVSAVVFNPKLNLWYIGSQADGLFVLKPKKFKVLSTFKNNPKNNFYLQIPINQDNIITNNGIVANSDNLSKFCNLQKIYTNNVAFKISPYEYMVQSNEEIFIYNSQHDDLKKIKSGKNLGYTNHYKWSTDTLLIVQYDSVFFYEPKFNKFTYLTKNNQTHLNIYRIVKIGNNLWISSCAGIGIFSIKNKSFIHNLFSNNCIREIFPTKKGVLVSTYGTGLFLVNDKSYESIQIPLDFRQNLLHTHAIYKNKNNDLIIPTNSGILKLPETVIFNSLNKKFLTQQPQYFNEQDGLPTDEFNGGTDPGFINFGDSLISFPSLKGLIQINPKKFIADYTINSFQISSIERSGEAVKLANNLIHLPTYTPEITFKINLTFWGNSFNLPLYYKYRNKSYFIPIEKLNNLRLIIEHYGYEPIEFYTLENNKIKSLLKINIFRNHLWYTQWYYLLIGIIALWGFLYAYDSARSFRTEQKEEKLQTLINEKTIALNQLNEELKIKIDQLVESNNNNQFYISVINHDIFAPIKFINLIGNQITNHNQKVTKYEILEHLNTIINTTKRLEILCSNILNHINSKRFEELEISSFPIIDVINELKLFFQIGLKLNQNELLINLNNDSLITSNKDALTIILTNIVSNAIRFTNQGEISITHKLNKVKHINTITISDTGKGISDKMLDNINQKNLQILNRDSIKYNSYGVGFNLIFKMLLVIKGEIKVSKNNPSGTTVTLTFPNQPKSDNGLNA